MELMGEFSPFRVLLLRFGIAVVTVVLGGTAVVAGLFSTRWALLVDGEAHHRRS